MSEIESVGFDKFQRFHSTVWYSKHKARHRNDVGRWFVMKNTRFLECRVTRAIVVKDLDNRKAAIAMVKLLESTNGNS
jgi:hypothetical protein